MLARPGRSRVLLAPVARKCQSPPPFGAAYVVRFGRLSVAPSVAKSSAAVKVVAALAVTVTPAPVTARSPPFMVNGPARLEFPEIVREPALKTSALLAVVVRLWTKRWLPD